MTTTSGSLILLGEPRNHLQVDELESSISPYTGRALRQIGFTVTVEGKDAHGRLRAELEAARDDKVFISDTGGIHWRVIRNDFSHQSGQTRFTHNVTLEEQEELALDRIEFDDISLIPERWSLESELGDVTVLTVLATLNPEQHQMFEQVLELRRAALGKNGYFPVDWIGITDTPVSMRFGRCLWQPLDEGAARHVIVFVSAENDNYSDSFGLHEPESTRTKEQLVAAKTKLDALIDELHRAGMLDDDAVSRINSSAANPPFSAWRVFDKTANVEPFFD